VECKNCRAELLPLVEDGRIEPGFCDKCQEGPFCGDCLEEHIKEECN
jgi:hypothetical protein